MTGFDVRNPIYAPSDSDSRSLINRSALNAALAGVGGGGGDVALTAKLGATMEPVKGMYPASDISINELQTAAPATYTAQLTVTPVDATPRMRVGGVLAQSEGFWWNAINGNDISSSSLSVASVTSYEIEFWISGTDFTLDLRNDASVTSAAGATDYRILVDDMFLPPSTGAVATIQNGWNHTPSSSTVRYHVLKFNENKVRRVRLMLGNIALSQVRLPGASDIWPAPRRFKVLTTGDSWGHASIGGTEGTIVAGMFPGELAIRTGWEVWNLHQGGTGYENPGAGGGTSAFWSADRQAAMAALPAVDLMMVVGGGNDSSDPNEEIAALADTMWNGMKAQRPLTPLVIVGAQAPALFAGLSNLNDALKAHAQANANVDLFVDMWHPEQWITGTSGDAENRSGTGSRDLFISHESVASIHPTHAGSRNVAERLARALRGVGTI